MRALAGLAVVALGCAGLVGCAAGREQSTPATPASTAAAPAGYVKHADFFTGVSCVTPSACFAVGWYYHGAAGPQRPLVAMWNGAAWRAAALTVGLRRGMLSAVSCASATACQAVGSPVIGWDGRSWRVELRASQFDAVSCPAANACVAVGVSPSTTPRALAGIWDGYRWRVTAMPVPRRAQTPELTGVSCASAGSCLAVGDYRTGVSAMPNPSSREWILAEYWNGTRWRILPARNVARINRLVAVSCSAPRQCLAVGSARDQFTLAERWIGGRWRAERTPDFGRPGYSQLVGLSCVSAIRCVAVGDYDLSVPYAEIRGSRGWSIIRLPSPEDQQGVVGLAASCVGTACQVVGGFDGRTLADYWNGSAWQLHPSPDPR